MCALARRLPSAAPGITSVQSKVVLRTQHLPGEHTKTASHSLTAHGDAITKCLKKNRLERDNERCCQLYWGIKDGPLTRVRSWGGTIKTRVLQYNRTGNTGYCEHVTEGNRKLSYKSNSHEQLQQRLVHTQWHLTQTRATQGGCKARAWKSLCTKEFSVNMVRWMFRTHGDRIKSTGSNGIPTQHKTSPEAWEQPGNTVLTIQWLGSDTLRALYRISVCT